MVSAAVAPPAAITVGASPFTYVAPSDGVLIVSGGSVSLVQYGRGTTLTALGLLGGVIPVQKGDSIRVTWLLSAPTITFIASRQT